MFVCCFVETSTRYSEINCQTVVPSRHLLHYCFVLLEFVSAVFIDIRLLRQLFVINTNFFLMRVSFDQQFDFIFICSLSLTLNEIFREERHHTIFYTLSGRTGSALAWHSERRTFAAQSVQ